MEPPTLNPVPNPIPNPNLNTLLLINILDEAPYDATIKLCQANKTIHKYCARPDFWEWKAHLTMGMEPDDFHLTALSDRERYIQLMMVKDTDFTEASGVPVFFGDNLYIIEGLERDNIEAVRAFIMAGKAVSSDRAIW